MKTPDKNLDPRNLLIVVGYYTCGLSMPTLAKVFGVNKQMIHKIISNMRANNKSVKTKKS